MERTNRAVETKFPGANVTYGSAASGKGDNREIPVEEGGSVRNVSGPKRLLSVFFFGGTLTRLLP